MNEIELAKSRLRGEGWDDSADAVERLEEQAVALTAAAGLSPLLFAKYAVHQDLESYGHIALDTNGREASDDIGYNGTPTTAKPRKGFRRHKGVGDEIDKKEQKAIWQAERRNSCYGKM